MNLSITLVSLWIITAGVLTLFPSRRHHWPLAYVLIAVGIPLLIFVYIENGLIYALGVLAVGCLVLRWPVFYLTRWVRRKLFG